MKLTEALRMLKAINCPHCGASGSIPEVPTSQDRLFLYCKRCGKLWALKAGLVEGIAEEDLAVLSTTGPGRFLLQFGSTIAVWRQAGRN
jgi:hypothetical protein